MLILSTRTIGASISPSLLGFSSFVLMLSSWRTRWRVICIKPNLLGGNILCLARSSAISLRRWSNRIRRFSLLPISIKSTTIIPPISRNRNCRAISVAAMRFTDSAVDSWSLFLLEWLPLFTSITCRASVCSITR